MTTPSSLRIATAAYSFVQSNTWSSYTEQLSAWLDVACEDGAQLLVLPEYAAMEMASLGGATVAADLSASLSCVADLAAERRAWFADQAQRRGCWIASGSGPVRSGTGYVNQAELHAPDGGCLVQQKLIMTRFERETWGIQAGQGLEVLQTPFGAMGILLCYDSEFPLLARRLIDLGAQWLLVPSCTDTPAGAQRVRIGCQARALENQCVVVRSSSVGAASWCEAIDVNHGTAGIYAPPDRGWPDDGVVAETVMDAPGWATAEIECRNIAAVRQHGAVLNWQHWPEQDEAVVGTLNKAPPQQ
jgi:predicted amidohydrolase